MNRLRMLLAQTAALMSGGPGGYSHSLVGPYSVPKTGHQRHSKYEPHQGKGEVARHKHQIDRRLVSPVYSAVNVAERVA